MRASCRPFLLALALAAGCDRPAGTTGAAPTAASAAATPPATATPSGPAPSASAPASAAPAPGKLPDNLSVILLTIDSLRADMPWAGYPRPIAPRLTALEKESVSYTRAYALSSYTSMSVGGFLAGDYPGAVKRDGYFFGTYPKDVLMFPERLQAAGVRTMSVQGHGYFKPGTGLSQGFDVWKIVPGLKWNAQTDENVTGPKMEQMAEEMLGDPQNTSGRFFAWFHFLDPHDQYMSHPEGTAWGKKARDLYDGEVEFTDVQIGKLLDFIDKQPWKDRVAIVVSADHGESFGEHGVYRHGFEIFQNLVRVPWFFHLPGVPGRRIDVPRSHLDLAPTLLSLLGLKPGSPADPAPATAAPAASAPAAPGSAAPPGTPAGGPASAAPPVRPAPPAAAASAVDPAARSNPPLRGVDLVPELLGLTPPAERDVIVDLPRTSDNDRRRALIRGKYKVIAYSDDAYFQVYDIEADPDEKNDLARTDKEAVKPLIEAYKQATQTIKDIKPYACDKLKGTPAKP